MVEKRQPERIGGAFQPYCYLAILRAGFEPPGGMVVRHDDGAGPVGQGVRENLARVNYGSIHETDRDDPRCDELMSAVE